MANTTLSYAHTPRPAVPYSYTTVLDHFAENVAKFPDKEMQVCYRSSENRTSKTFSEFDKQSDQIAKHLLKQGVDDGVVGILGMNSFHFTTGILSALKARCTFLNIDVGMTDGSDVIATMTKAGCVGLIADCGKDNELSEYVHRVIKNYNIGRKLVVVLMNGPPDTNTYPTYASIADSNLDDISLPTISVEDGCMISTTSGSTGIPKLVLWNHFALINSLTVYPTSPHEISFNDRPFTWGLGSPLHDIIFGWTRVFFTQGIFSRMPQGGMEYEIWELIKREKCTKATLMPYTIKDLMKYVDKLDPYRLKMITIAGQITDAFLAQGVGTLSHMLLVAYGTTEFNAIAMHPVMKSGSVDVSLPTGFVGKPFFGMEVSIRDDENKVMKRGDIGLITLRSSIRFSGYIGLEEKYLLDIFKENGWISMGDMGSMDEEGNLTVVGRVKDIIQKGTMKIIPSDIENVITRFPGIRQAVVVSVPDDRFREEICACFVCDQGCTISLGELEKHCEENFILEKVVNGVGRSPKYFLPFDTFPFLKNGKLNRRGLRDLAKEQLGLI